MRLQGYSKNPGADQVTSKGSRVGLGGSGSGKGAPTSKSDMKQPQNGVYSPKAVHTQQLSPNRSKPDATADYAGDGKSYGVGGNKVLPSSRYMPSHHRKS